MEQSALSEARASPATGTPATKASLPAVTRCSASKGELVTGLQTTFAENWLQSSEKLLADVTEFPPAEDDEERSTIGLVVISSPSAGNLTRNRIFFQLLLAASRKTIHGIPRYFLPDRSATAEFTRAVRERNVDVKIIVPGKWNNHGLTRLASRRRYGPLLKAGVEIDEYHPGMIHTKSMTVDGLWTAVGSTNFDSRSFDLNDEVNLVVRQRIGQPRGGGIRGGPAAVPSRYL